MSRSELKTKIICATCNMQLNINLDAKSNSDTKKTITKITADSANDMVTEIAIDPCPRCIGRVTYLFENLKNAVNEIEKNSFL